MAHQNNNIQSICCIIVHTRDIKHVQFVEFCEILCNRANKTSQFTKYEGVSLKVFLFLCILAWWM